MAGDTTLLDVEVEEGRYCCPAESCTARFKSVGDKKRHMRAEHADTKPNKEG